MSDLFNFDPMDLLYTMSGIEKPKEKKIIKPLQPQKNKKPSLYDEPDLTEDLENVSEVPEFERYQQTAINIREVSSYNKRPTNSYAY